MKKRKETRRSWKGAAVGMVLCFVVAIAFAGNVLFQPSDDAQDTEKMEQEELQQQPLQEANSQTVENEMELEDIQPVEEPEETTRETNSDVSPLAFSADNLILWPVDGNVILNYSMDQTVYFATLDQYKYNPAVLISGETGMEVVAVERGIVSAVEEHAQTGVTMTVEMGNGYEAVYGQLKDVRVSAGEYVKQGQVIGCLENPTKYYSVEGCNLYFQLLKDGEPVNPMEYLDV